MRPRVATWRRSGSGVTVAAVRVFRIAVLAACLTSLAAAGCSHQSAQSRSGCEAPTATASTTKPFQVGAAGAPTLGPFSFHPYPYRRGFPVKMIIHAVNPQPQPLVLRGYRCSDGLALRFRYGPGATNQDGPLPPSALEALGVEAQTLQPVGEGGDHTGYVLPTSSGEWLIILTRGGKALGTLRLDVEP